MKWEWSSNSAGAGADSRRAYFGGKHDGSQAGESGAHPFSVQRLPTAGHGKCSGYRQWSEPARPVTAFEPVTFLSTRRDLTQEIQTVNPLISAG